MLENRKLDDQGMIWKSNALVEASYRLTIAEQRIMLACISQVKRNKPVTDDILYSVTASDFSSLSGSDTNTSYEELEKAALRLKRREVWIKEKPNGGGEYEQTLVTSWVQSIRYIKHEGRVELRFAKDMLPYLSEFARQFTTYALRDVAKMTSAHAIRLYEMLMQWKSQGQCIISVQDLKSSMMLEDKYSLMADFRRWVIEPAVKQINEYTPVKVTWETKKTGRRITHIQFNFEHKRIAKKKEKKIEKDLITQPIQKEVRSASEKQKASEILGQMMLHLDKVT